MLVVVWCVQFWLRVVICVSEGPSTQYSSSLVPNPIESVVFETRDHKYWVLGPCGCVDMMVATNDNHGSYHISDLANRMVFCHGLQNASLN